jgi:hypothetical protein
MSNWWCPGSLAAGRRPFAITAASAARISAISRSSAARAFYFPIRSRFSKVIFVADDENLALREHAPDERLAGRGLPSELQHWMMRRTSGKTSKLLLQQHAATRPGHRQPGCYSRRTMIEQKTLEFRTRGRGTTDVTTEVARAVAASGIARGLATVFLQHTSAPLILCANADPGVRRDLETLRR